MIPILFESTETSFNNNGICRLYDCISCIVSEERNSIFECDFEYPTNGANYDQIECGRIIGVTHDDSTDIQPFDIVSYSKPIDGIVTFHAVHISYRLRGYVVTTENINALSSAMTALGTATPSNPFTFSADYDTNAYCGAFNGIPRSVRQLLGGIEGSILDTYGGEYEWDKFNVILHRARGTTVDFSIRYGLNMVDYNDEVDFSQSYTTCIPYWIGDDGNGGQIIVKGNKVDSGLTPHDGHEKCSAIDLSEKFETQPTTADLEAYALNMMVSKAVNSPKQSIQVDFVRLQDFPEYAQFESLLECKLCDSIQVIFPDYEVSGFFKIVKTEYDVLRNKYNSMELGTLSTTLSEALGIGEQSSGSVSGGSGGGYTIRYGVCSDSASTVAKTVTVDPPIGALVQGTIIYVKFNNSNSASNPTLNVNGLGAVRICRYGTTAVGTSDGASWNANSIVELMYSGTAWEMIGWLNTTYSSMTEAEYQAGTSTTARLITPARLKGAIEYWAVPKSGGTMTGQLKTSFKSSVAMGAYGSAQTTVNGLADEVRMSSGCMGSASINTAYTLNNITIPTGWYNFIYTPHRSGGLNGGTDGDNTQYGNLFLLGMNNTNGQFIVRISSSAIAEVIRIASTSAVKDYIIEEDTSTANTGVWHYRKWASGKAECWGKWQDSTAANTSDGGGYRTSGVTPGNFPTGLFASIPHIAVSVYAGSTILTPVCISNPSAAAVGKWAGYRVDSNTSTAAKTFCFYCISR